VSNGSLPALSTNAPMSASFVEPTSPKINDMPYSISADDSTPMR